MPQSFHFRCKQVPFPNRPRKRIQSEDPCECSQGGHENRQQLASLHRFLKPRMEQEPLVHFLGKVVPGKKWLQRHMQHVCCELRRWQTRQRDGSSQAREASGVSKQARVRAERLCKVFKHIGFTAVPPLAKKYARRAPSSVEPGT